ncbi:MAG: DUF805 domain-containing protein [Henriciella sp.]|nr:DUF805 domain-containing protein [Henriciella sp.]
MGDLLFNPQGRIDRNRFWQGMVVLTVCTVLVSAGYRMVAVPLVFLHFVLVYPYICVIGKRLHDAGFSAGLVVLVWIGAMIANQFVSGILGAFLISEETMAAYEAVVGHLERNEIDPAMEGMVIVLRDTLSTAIAAGIVTNAIVAMAVGAFPSQPRDNKHGPPMSGAN